MNGNKDLIAAVATSLGTAAVSVIRMSGDGAFEAADRVFRAYNGASVSSAPPRALVLGEVTDGTRAVDRALCARFVGGGSFTGEDCVELHCHGGVALTLSVLNLLKKAGARGAEPGEFTKRAFLNGKLDLTEAEGIADLIEAESEAELRAGGELMSGGLKKICGEFRERLLALLSEIDAAADFPDEYDGRDLAARAGREAAALRRELEKLRDTYGAGRLIKAGVNCVLAGGVNVGKSSLLNALLGETRAIVTDAPGTTRDAVTGAFSRRGIKINLTDTAGLRDSSDPIEREGMRRARERAAAADVVLRVYDASAAAGAARTDNGADAELKRAAGKNGSSVIDVFNKADLLTGKIPAAGGRRVYVSAKTGLNLDVLADMIVESAGAVSAGGLLLTTERQRDAVAAAADAAGRAAAALSDGVPPDVAYIELKAARDSLGRVTGESGGEDIINALFSRFCVGK